jgi:hypothetical protein
VVWRRSGNQTEGAYESERTVRKLELRTQGSPEHEDYTLYSSHSVLQSKATFEAWGNKLPRRGQAPMHGRDGVARTFIKARSVSCCMLTIEASKEGVYELDLTVTLVELELSVKRCAEVIAYPSLPI